MSDLGIMVLGLKSHFNSQSVSGGSINSRSPKVLVLEASFHYCLKSAVLKPTSDISGNRGS